MKVTFDVKVSTKDVFGFNMYQTYHSMQGVISVLLPAIIVGVIISNFEDFQMEKALFYLIISGILLLYIPVSLWLRSKAVLKTNESLAKPLHYEFEEERICVSQDDQQAEFKWENIYKMVATRSLVLVYTNRLNAYIIPKEQMEDKYGELVQLAGRMLDKSRMRLRLK